MTFDPMPVAVTFPDHIFFAIIVILDLTINQSMWIQWPLFQKLEPKVIDPKMTFDCKSVEVTCVTLPKGHCVQVPWKYIEVCGYSDPFFKNLNQRSLTPRWPLTPCLLRSLVWPYPRIIVSKSHGNTSMYVDTVINFAKYHIRTTYIHTYTLQTVHTTYRMSDHIVSYWTQFRRDNNLWFLYGLIRQ